MVSPNSLIGSVRVVTPEPTALSILALRGLTLLCGRRAA